MIGVLEAVLRLAAASEAVRRRGQVAGRYAPAGELWRVRLRAFGASGERIASGHKSLRAA